MDVPFHILFILKTYSLFFQVGIENVEAYLLFVYIERRKVC